MADVELTVIIPVYNGMPYLPEAIDSILVQKSPRFEVLIINDGSRDETVFYLNTIADDRVRIIHQENRGLCATMNRGFEEARAAIVARMDQDDISHPNRLERQFDYLKAHPEVDCVFSLTHKFGAKRSWKNIDKYQLDLVYGLTRAYDPRRDGSLLHSTMMGKRAMFLNLGGYRPAYFPADDWDLSLRMAEKYGVNVLAEPLVMYRFHDRANTYRYFTEMQHRRRWAEDCAYRRSKGLGEEGFEEYLGRSKQSKIRYFNRKRKDTAKFYMRRAGQEFLDSGYLGMVHCLLLATLLDPLSTFRRLIRLRENMFSGSASK